MRLCTEFPRHPQNIRAEETTPLEQKLAFARYQIAKLVGFMAVGTTAASGAEIIEKTGRECAKLGQLQVKFKGDLEGYLAAIKKAWGTDSSWNKEKGIINLMIPEGECGCPMVDSKRCIFEVKLS